MRGIFLTIFIYICTFSMPLFSQNIIDTTYLRCTYNYLRQTDTITGVVKDDMIILQIGSNMSKSFSYFSYQVDSLYEMPNGDKIWTEIFEKELKKEGLKARNFPRKRMKTYVYKKYPKGKMTVTDGFSLQDYIYKDELNAQNWQFIDSTKTVLDYSCQMSVCDFRGRQWTAWFAPDIPVSDGPWKFCGLPGLILEVYDRGSQYHFTAIGLQKAENEPIIFSKTYVGSKKFEKTNRLDFLKAQKRYLMDMNGYIQMETGIDLSGGQPEKIMRYDLMERDYN
ncbi:MAG: GLPGLI family protein [Bacteroidia bacterium]|nr:GLPGLI family protein [Bacteroidia bacterium]